jgi:hypothetical protein
MKNQKKGVRKGERPVGKEKTSKPRPAPAPRENTGGGDDEARTRHEEREAYDNVIAPDGEPEPKEKRTPLF